MFFSLVPLSLSVAHLSFSLRILDLKVALDLEKWCLMYGLLEVLTILACHLISHAMLERSLFHHLFDGWKGFWLGGDIESWVLSMMASMMSLASESRNWVEGDLGRWLVRGESLSLVAFSQLSFFPLWRGGRR